LGWRIKNWKDAIDPETNFKKPGRLEVGCRLEKWGVMDRRTGGKFDS
jgi:hypothetical protein